VQEFNKGLERPFSERTIRRKLQELGLKSLVAVLKPSISPKNAKLRLAFARLTRNWTVERWRKVIWSDETSVAMHWRPKFRVRRRSHERYHRDCVQGTSKSGRDTQMFWGAFCYDQLGPLVECKGNVNADAYIEHIKNHLLPFMKGEGDWGSMASCPMAEYRFMQDNASSHKAKKTMEFFSSSGINLLAWPPQSPDLNPIENVWATLKRRIAQQRPSNQANQRRIAAEEWSKIDADFLKKLVDSMPDRVKAVIEAKGYQSRW
jgi:DDE superfamily endonuclease/transposase